MQKKSKGLSCEKELEALAKGETGALSAVYDKMARSILGLAYGITENYHDAEDVLQNTMLELMKYADRYRKGTNANALILTIARHLAIDQLRKRKKTVSLDTPEAAKIPAEKPDLSGVEVMDLLRVLDEEERQILLLRLYAGLSYQEIAMVMQITVLAAQKRYQRVIRKLRKYF